MLFLAYERKVAFSPQGSFRENVDSLLWLANAFSREPRGEHSFRPTRPQWMSPGVPSARLPGDPPCSGARRCPRQNACPGFKIRPSLWLGTGNRGGSPVAYCLLPCFLSTNSEQQGSHGAGGCVGQRWGHDGSVGTQGSLLGCPHPLFKHLCIFPHSDALREPCILPHCLLRPGAPAAPAYLVQQSEQSLRFECGA